MRNLNENNLKKIKNWLAEKHWHDLNNCEVDRCFTKIIETVQQAVNHFAPEKIVTIPPKNIIEEPWMTKGLFKSSRKRNQLYKKMYK